MHLKEIERENVRRKIWPKEERKVQNAVRTYNVEIRALVLEKTDIRR
jgi:hypothetical protein